MTQKEQQLKVKLMETIDEFIISDITDGTFGYVPDNITETMADAAFAVLMAIKGTNDYFGANPPVTI